MHHACGHPHYREMPEGESQLCRQLTHPGALRVPEPSFRQTNNSKIAAEEPRPRISEAPQVIPTSC